MSAFTGALGSLWVEVGAKITKFESDMATVGKTINDTVKNAEERFAGFDKLGSTLTSIGTGLTAGLTVPMAGIAAASIKLADDFQSSMNRVSALGEITGKDLETLKATAIDLGAKTQFSSKQAADGMAELAAAGFNTTDVLKAIPSVMDLAASGQLEVGRSAEIAANIMGGFGISAGGVGHAVDVMASAAAKGSLSVSDMASTFKYVGPVATAAGLSLEEVAAATTLLSNAGIKGEQAGTTLRGALARLLDPSKEAQAALDALGVTITDSAGKMLPFADIIAQLGAKGAATKDIFKIFGQETASGVQALVAKGAPALRTMTEELTNSDGAAKKMAETMQQGLPGAIERAKGSIETAGITIGEALAPAIIKVAGIIEEAANVIAGLATAFGTLPEPVQYTVLAVAAFVAAVGPVVLILGQVIGSISTVATALGLFSTAATAAGVGATGFGATLSAAVGASSLLAPALILVGGALVGLQFKQVADEATSLWEALTTTSSAAGNSKGVFDQLKESLFGVGSAGESARASIDSTNKSLSAGHPITQQTIQGVSLLSGALAQVTEVLGNFSRIISSVKWSDFLTPVGLVRNALVQLTDAVSTVRGVFPSMEKAGTDALGKLQEANRNSMRAFADHAMAAINVGKAHAKAKQDTDSFTSSITKATSASVGHAKAANDSTSASKESSAATKVATEVIKPLIDKSNELWQTSEKLTEQHRKAISAIVDWKLAHQDAASVVPKLTQVSDDLDVAINKIVTDSAPLGDVTSSAFLKIVDIATQARAPIDELTGAFKNLQITSTASLVQLASDAYANFEKIRDSGVASVTDIAAAHERAMEAQAKASDEGWSEIRQEQGTSIEVMGEQLKEGHSKQKSSWEDFSKQVSTIVTDAGKNIIDKFLNVGKFNQKLDEQETALKGSLEKQQGEYETSVADIQKQLGKIHDTYAETLAKEETSLQESLASRKADYEDYAAEVADKLDEVQSKHKDQADKETQSALGGLDDKTQDYDDYVSDISKKITEIRKKHSDSAAKETKTLQDSLADRTKTYNRYVEDATIDIARLREKNKGANSDEEDDLARSLQRRMEDFNQFQQETQQALIDVSSKHATDAAAEEQEQRDALARRTRDFNEYQADVAAKLAEITATHAAAQAKEEDDLKSSLSKKQAAMDQYQQDTIAKSDAARADALAKLTDQETDLKATLADQTADWEKYKNDVSAQLQEIADKHVGIFGTLKTVALGVFSEIGVSIGRLVTEQLVGNLFQKLGSLVTDILPGVGRALSGALGSAGSAAGAAGSAPGIGGAGGAASGASGAAGAGLTGILGAAGSIAGAVSGIVGNFQNAKQETSLNAIEHNTRYSMMFLGERGDGGIVTASLRSAEYLGYLNTSVDTIGKYLSDWLSPANNALQDIMNNVRGTNARLNEISTNTYWGSQSDKDNSLLLSTLRDLLTATRSVAPTITVYVNGVQAPESAVSLKMQGALI